ncbi:SPOR domain-containing protein [Comamonas piscis]
MAIFNLRWPGKKQQEAESPRVIRAPRSNPAESVDAMRRRARHRLIGATVLVLAAIIGFPMLFDTQPRPVPVNASIEIPDRERVAALAVPPAANASGASHSAPSGTDNGLDAGEEIVGARNNTSGTAATAPLAAGATAAAAAASKPADKPATTPAKPEPAAKPEAKPEPKPAAKPEPKPEPKPEAKPKEEPKPKPAEPTKPKRDDEADRVRAMMEGRTASAAAAAAAPAVAPAAKPAAAARYAIQVGAFAEESKAAEVRAKLQMAGVPAFTQSVKTASGTRIRVRVGPFNSKEEADSAAAKVRAQGLPAALLPL